MTIPAIRMIIMDRHLTYGALMRCWKTAASRSDRALLGYVVNIFFTWP